MSHVFLCHVDRHFFIFLQLFSKDLVPVLNKKKFLSTVLPTRDEDLSQFRLIRFPYIIGSLFILSCAKRYQTKRKEISNLPHFKNLDKNFYHNYWWNKLSHLWVQGVNWNTNVWDKHRRSCKEKKKLAMKSEWERKYCRHANNGFRLGEKEDQRESPRRMKHKETYREFKLGKWTT